MACRFLLVVFAVAGLAAPVVAQNGDQSLPPPSFASEANAPVVTPSHLNSGREAPDSAWVERWWFSGNYMLGWGTPVHLPPLVTTSPVGTSAGVLGNPSTLVLTGNKNSEGSAQSGFKLGMGSWFDEYNTLGFDTGFFMLAERKSTFVATSDGSTILARPFTNATDGSQTSLLVAFPKGSGPSNLPNTAASGSISVSANSGPFYSVYFDLQENIYRDSGFRFNSLLGYRFLRCDDGLQVRQTTTILSTTSDPITPGTQIFSQDNFAAHNTFNGVELGFETEWQRERWSLSFLAKVAAGRMENTVNINGITQVTASGSKNQFAGGLLALSSNSGTYQNGDWTAAPEFGLTLSWNATSNIRLSLGYSLLLFFDVARAGNQIDLNINPNLLNHNPLVSTSSSGGSQPAFDLHQSTLLLQSINVGMEFRF